MKKNTMIRITLIFLAFALLLAFSGCQKEPTPEELAQIQDEIGEAWRNGEYPGIVSLGIELNDSWVTVYIYEGHEKARQTADALTAKYANAVKIVIGDYHAVNT
ncbi:MAG: hypothetical protein J6Q53_08885 [Oscillospiraceae bacterium]|nr:hypothetical protein [Oscillospiraceae bacterium]